MEARNLKRVVIKEEIFALTKDTFEAIILGQLIYWQERVKDFDKFIEEEKERKSSEGITLNIESQNGWIYKSSKQLIEECMLTISEVTMRKYLRNLEEKGFIESRSNPTKKWDKVLQYRVDLVKVIQGIQNNGYDGLSGYSLTNNLEFPSEQNNLASKLNFLASERNILGAIPETNNKNYNKEDKDISLSKKEEDNWRSSFDEYLSLVNEARDLLLDDDEFYDKMNVYYPNADYDKTIDKMVSMFWGTEAGWQNKKAKRTKKINMLSTLKNNYPKNIVYKERGQVGRVRMSKTDSSNVKENNNVIIGGVEYK